MVNKGKILLMETRDTAIVYTPSEHFGTRTHQIPNFTQWALESQGYEVQVISIDYNSHEETHLEGVVAIVANIDSLDCNFLCHDLKKKIWNNDLEIPVIGYKDGFSSTLDRTFSHEPYKLNESEYNNDTRNHPAHMDTVCWTYQGTRNKALKLAEIVTDTIARGRDAEKGFVYEFKDRYQDTPHCERSLYLKK